MTGGVGGGGVGEFGEGHVAAAVAPRPAHTVVVIRHVTRHCRRERVLPM